MPARAILITGAAGGLGTVMTAALLKDGHTIAAVDRSADGLARLMASLGVGPERLLTVEAGLSQPAACAQAVEAAVAHFGRLEGVVNNAGIGMSSIRPDAETRHPGLAEMTVDIWDHFFAVNVRAPMLIAQAALPVLNQELVQIRHLATAADISKSLAVGRLSPGPTGMFVVSLGYLVAGWPGAFLAMLGSALPPLVVLPLAPIIRRSLHRLWVGGFMRGIGLASAGLLLAVSAGIVTADGTHRPLDAIICGTGFQVNDVDAPFRVTGVGGADLGAAWRRDGPEAYLGASVAGSYGGTVWDRSHWVGVELFLAVLLFAALGATLFLSRDPDLSPRTE